MATGTNFAALTTLLPDGTPQTHVMWVDADDDHVLIDTEVHRAKFANLQRDPRVTVTVWERTDQSFLTDRSIRNHRSPAR